MLIQAQDASFVDIASVIMVEIWISYSSYISNIPKHISTCILQVYGNPCMRDNYTGFLYSWSSEYELVY